MILAAYHLLLGVFVADPSANEPLRLTEPKAHDAWQTTRAAGDIHPDHAALARGVLNWIKKHVNSFRSELKSPAKPADELRLPEFDRIMRAILKGGGPGKAPPPVDARPFSIRPGGEVLPNADGRLCLSGTARVEFSAHHSPETPEGDEIEVSVQYRFVEEDRAGGRAELAIQVPHGFIQVPGRTDTFRGRLEASSMVEIEYVSEDYEPSWTGRLFVNAKLLPTHQASGIRTGDIQ